MSTLANFSVESDYSGVNWTVYRPSENLLMLQSMIIDAVSSLKIIKQSDTSFECQVFRGAMLVDRVFALSQDELRYLLNNPLPSARVWIETIVNWHTSTSQSRTHAARVLGISERTVQTVGKLVTS